MKSVITDVIKEQTLKLFINSKIYLFICRVVIPTVLDTLVLWLLMFTEPCAMEEFLDILLRNRHQKERLEIIIDRIHSA